MQPKYRLSDVEYNVVKEEMHAIMLQCAKAKETIAYSELTRRLSVPLHWHSPLMIRLLNEIGEIEYEAGRGILPAVVVRKDSGIPGGGYFQRSGIADPDELKAVWEADLKELFDYWENHS